MRPAALVSSALPSPASPASSAPAPPSTASAMAFDLWTHQFCLACDKQVQSDGAAYCSEACRLADHERTSTPSSQASSPGFTPPAHGYSWSTTEATPPQPTTMTIPTRSKLYLPLPDDWYNTGLPCRGAPCPSKYAVSWGDKSTTSTASLSNLTPSSSHSSLCSMQSTSSANATPVGQVEAGAQGICHLV